jgi:hypothetical protein
MPVFGAHRAICRPPLASRGSVSQCSVQSLCSVLQMPTRAPDSLLLHAALATGGSDAPRAPSFPRKKSLTRTTY